jgi:hypothetical protein
MTSRSCANGCSRRRREKVRSSDPLLRSILDLSFEGRFSTATNPTRRESGHDLPTWSVRDPPFRSADVLSSITSAPPHCASRTQTRRSTVCDSISHIRYFISHIRHFISQISDTSRGIIVTSSSSLPRTNEMPREMRMASVRCCALLQISAGNARCKCLLPIPASGISTRPLNCLCFANVASS